MAKQYSRYVVTQTYVEALEPHTILCASTTAVTFNLTVKPTWDVQSDGVY